MDVSGLVIEGWQRPGTTGYLRFYYSEDWVDADGHEHVAGMVGNKDFFLEVPLTVNTTTKEATPTGGSFSLTPTTNALENPGVTVSCIILDAARGRIGNAFLFSDWHVPHTLGSSAAYSALVLYNNTRRVFPAAGYLDSLGVWRYRVTGVPATLAQQHNGGFTFQTAAAGIADAPITWSSAGTLRPFKVYVALLTQAGASAPVATVLENTLGGTVVWTRDSAGEYTGTLAGAFGASKTVVFVNARADMSLGSGADARRDTDSTLRVTSYSGGMPDDTALSAVSIEVRVYP